MTLAVSDLLVVSGMAVVRWGHSSHPSTIATLGWEVPHTSYGEGGIGRAIQEEQSASFRGLMLWQRGQAAGPQLGCILLYSWKPSGFAPVGKSQLWHPRNCRVQTGKGAASGAFQQTNG